MTRSAATEPGTAHGGAPRGGRWWRLAPVEARLLLRRRTTLIGMLSGPAMMILFAVLVRPDSAPGWGMLAGLAALVGTLVSVYVTAATVFTLRRESGALSRLRTTELSGPGIVLAAGVPLLVVGLVQALLVVAVYLLLGAPIPANPALLVLGLVLGGAFCVAAGAATSTFSRSAESVQFTATPLLLVAAVAANVLVSGATGPLRGALLLVPGTPMADVVALAWAGAGPGTDVAGIPALLLDPLLLILWTAAAVLIATASWRWTPR